MYSWKVAGALVSPNGITVYSKWPYLVRNAIFHWSGIRLPLISFLDADPMVRVADVKARIDPGVSQTVQRLLNERQRVPVLDRHGVKAPVVHA